MKILDKIKKMEKLDNENVSGNVIVIGNGFGRKCVTIDSINRIIGRYFML